MLPLDTIGHMELHSKVNLNLQGSQISDSSDPQALANRLMAVSVLK
jgi:hypothetical protein